MAHGFQRSLRTFGGRAGALILGAALGTGCDGGPPAGANGGRDAAGDAVQAPACAWAPAAPELTLPEGEVKGALRGASRNLSTTCTGQKATGGPEAIYLLRLTERTVLDVEVVSEMDTVLAVRRVCDDPLTELACSDDTGSAAVSPQPGQVDAGSSLPGPDTRNAHLRASLEAGNYFLLVDEAEPFGVGGAFQLQVRTSPPPAQTSCADAPLVGARLVGEELDLAGASFPCADGDPRPALFYRVVIPPGQRLTARAVPTAGDRTWTPALRAFTGCSPGGASGAGANLCLASDRADAEGQPRLRYVNSGPTEQTVLLAVSWRELVHSAHFRLDVALDQPPPNTTCATALPLSDRLYVRDQDLSEGQTASSSTSCSPAGRPSLFYQATLSPGQSVQVQVDSYSGDSGSPPLFLVREGCTNASCLNFGFLATSYVNRDSASRTVIVEATTSSNSSTPPIFSFRVTMPPPPAEISTAVRPTSESGVRSTF